MPDASRIASDGYLQPGDILQRISTRGYFIPGTDHAIAIIATFPGGAVTIAPSIVFATSPDDSGDISPTVADFTVYYDGGETATFTAPVRDPAGFRWWGWYIGSTRVSWNKEYAHAVVGDATIEARYRHNAGRQRRRWIW